MSRSFPLLTALGLCLALAVPATALAEKPVVKLVEAGSGKKAPLRHAPKKGIKQTMTMGMDMTMAMNMAGQAMPPQQVPTITMTMDTEVTEVKGDSFTVSFSYTDVSVAEGADPQMVAAMKESMQGLVGATGEYTMDAQGFALGGSMVPAEGASAQVKDITANMERMVSQATPPFPAEAVGVGAVWTVTTKIENQGMAIDQVATYTLKGRTGDVVELGVTLNQSADKQTIKTPQGDAELVSLKGTGTGANRIDLSKGTVLDGKVSSDTDFVMAIAMGDQKMEASVAMGMGVTMANKDR